VQLYINVPNIKRAAIKLDSSSPMGTPSNVKLIGIVDNILQEL